MSYIAFDQPYYSHGEVLYRRVKIPTGAQHLSEVKDKEALKKALRDSAKSTRMLMEGHLEYYHRVLEKYDEQIDFAINLVDKA
jgi:hypothetical protein